MRNQQRRLVTFALLLSVMVGCGAESPPAETAVRRKGRTVGTIPAKERSTAGAPIPITMKSLMHPVKEGMQVLEQTSERVVFAGQPGDIYSLTLKKGKHGLPEDVTELRSVIRKQAAGENGGIVQVEKIDVHGLNAFLFLTKDVGERFQGYRYVGRCVIPAEDCWFELRMDCVDMGPAGSREAAAQLQLQSDGEVEYESIPREAPPTPGPQPGPDAKRIKGWARDPYASEFDAQANLSVSDDPKYDEHFPNHPLSRLRREFPEIIDGLVVSDELRASAARAAGERGQD